MPRGVYDRSKSKAKRAAKAISKDYRFGYQLAYKTIDVIKDHEDNPSILQGFSDGVKDHLSRFAGMMPPDLN